ncbi:hypothetical protein EYB53_023525 [Candidatus Chloroploca sp. M-50]|uniref:Prevent-host-death protein n=1 Tax=Candidatus Chloroploca mongolica TaxID=2528176 RepID=A0ABS4DH04_9CHLR|nr:hypothetical protein [Candidatus Chloroploca mongolica]MBP1468705.1 hypothetical protein [Candidatus Chloroploca mongolica]
MKHLDLTDESVDMRQFLEFIQEGPVVLRAPNGKEYLIAEADDFAGEVEQLRNSFAFQQFLDARSARGKSRRPLAAVVAEIDEELEKTGRP